MAGYINAHYAGTIVQTSIRIKIVNCASDNLLTGYRFATCIKIVYITVDGVPTGIFVSGLLDIILDICLVIIRSHGNPVGLPFLHIYVGAGFGL